ncbi:MAG: T9SS type A sorting domain-containing protein [Bradyrhizobiaceae bacterium]|nr:T9SS type A sorting domain-containing protein [Bradyrhizobiaceae bacterium]
MKSLIIGISIIVASTAMSAEVYKYDQAGRLVSVRYDNGLETTYTYDKNGNIIKVTTAEVNSVDDDVQYGGIQAFPTPALDKVTLRGLPDGIARVIVSSLHGTVVIDQQYTSSNALLTLDTQSLAPGVYAIKVSIEGKSFYTHVVVM